MELSPERDGKEKDLPSKLGEYEIEKKLGSGGEATVYKARTRDGREVALKHLKTPLTETQQEVLRRLQSIRRSGVGKIRAFSSDASNGHFLEMDLIDGKNLDDFLGEKPLDLHQGVTVVLGIVDALECAQGRKVAHGDIKPSNVMITEDLDIVVTDFGMSRLVEGVDISKSLTDTHASQAGTLLYMSPEQLEGKKIDFRSDVYSVGKLMMRVFFGMKASEDSSNIPASAPQKLKTIIQKCLKKNPDERFQSMQELRQVLEDFQEELHLPRVAQGIPILSSLVIFFYFLIHRMATIRDISKLKTALQKKEREVEALEEEQEALQKVYEEETKARKKEREDFVKEKDALRAAKEIAEEQLKLELEALKEAKAEIRRLTGLWIRESDPTRKNFPKKISVQEFLNPTLITEVKIEKGGYGKYQNLKSSAGNLLPDVSILCPSDAALYHWTIQTFSALPEIRLRRQSYLGETFFELQIGIPGGRMFSCTLSEELVKGMNHKELVSHILNADGVQIFFPTKQFLLAVRSNWDLFCASTGPTDLGGDDVNELVEKVLPHLSIEAHIQTTVLRPKLITDMVELTAFVVRVLTAIP